ncbi:riboflavin synthase [Paramicrobacterium agarici]|uniref:Riboflavin synthase n=1 Tax=Paramicrobacterium agarici TaxID=630514 RepID=A0A2A9DZ70_9MICO|nr:riboflavin synthase [Microbacterium agarici]PFG31988.1 riboflavin synthase alpha chain [Microbacterium agarici]
MFTGIIEEIGTVTAVTRSVSSLRLSVQGPLAVSDARHGDSIAVSGVCLTVVEQSDDSFTADVMGQTLAMSTLDTVDVGRRVNLERAAHVGDRLGGHIVQGHVDGTSRLESIRDDGDWRVLRFSLASDLARLVVDKGSVAVDGTSLTVSAVAPAELAQQWFEVSLIPETLAATTLGELRVGDHVNIETDIIARHVERMLARDAAEGNNR